MTGVPPLCLFGFFQLEISHLCLEIHLVFIVRFPLLRYFPFYGSDFHFSALLDCCPCFRGVTCSGHHRPRLLSRSGQECWMPKTKGVKLINFIVASRTRTIVPSRLYPARPFFAPSALSLVSSPIFLPRYLAQFANHNQFLLQTASCCLVSCHSITTKAHFQR